eukprot:2624238-Amphidinium_carterae.1
MWGLIRSAEKMVDEMKFELSVIRPDLYSEQMKEKESGDGASSSAGEHIRLEPLTVNVEDDEEVEYGELAWTLVQNLVKHRSLSMKSWTEPPLSLVCLLGSEADRCNGLVALKSDWEALEWSEQVAGESLQMARLLGSIPWVNNPACREMLLNLRQHNHEFVCEPLQYMLNQTFKGANNS